MSAATATASRRVRIRRGLVGVGVVVAAALAYARVRTGVPVPSMLARVGGEFSQPELWQALALSIRRCATGGSIGVLLGLVIGLAIGTSRLASTMLLPTFNLLKLVSSFAWIPLILTWFGLGEGSKIVFIALVAYLPVLFNAVDGAMAVPAKLEDLEKVYGLSRLQGFAYVTVPAAMPSLFSGFHMALIAGWMATIGAEYMLTSGGGIGAYLIAARDSLDLARLVTGLVVTGGFGFVLLRACQAAESHVLRWRDGSGG